MDINETSGEKEKLPQDEQTETVNGEYRFKGGYTQRIYTDAHFVPADENTAPPRYYTPPQPAEKKPRNPEHKAFPAWVKLVSLSLVCALLGGAVGALLVRRGYDDRVAAMEAGIAEINRRTDSLEADVSAVSDSRVFLPGAFGQGLTASGIYDIACKQVVGISTEVTSTNFFGMTSSSAVTGSGFFISDDGHILTNYHVVEYAYEDGFRVTVMLHDGTKYDASIVGVEESRDIAVLKIDADSTPCAAMGNSDDLRVGDSVYAVGNPLGELEFTMTFGRVSALDRLISTAENADGINMFQFDAAVNKGNSGGPLYDENGSVIGVVTAKAGSAGVEGIGFAVPVNDVASITNDLITKGYVSGKASMGVTIDTNYSLIHSQYFGIPMGAYVGRVAPGSAADKAGIKLYDIIVQLDEQKIGSYSDLKSALKHYSAGDTAQVGVYRSGEMLTMSLTFDEALPDRGTSKTC